MFNKNLPSSKRTNDPWYSFQDEMRNLLSRFSDDWSDLGPLASTTEFIPKVDFQEHEKNYLVTVEVPGMTEKDININLDENVLILEGEKKSETKDEGKDFRRSEIKYGKFYRQIPLKGEVDDNKVEATYKNGILKINLGKKEGFSKRAKKIEINTKHQIQ
jgi:HSP20 family protein